MVDDRGFRSFIQGLTTPKGAFLAAPAILGAALLFSVVSGGEPSIARDSGTLAAVTDSASEGGAGRASETLVNEAAAAGGDKPLQLAASGKPAAASSTVFSAEQRTEIGKIIREYLLANPEVLIEVSTELEKKRKESETANQAKLLVDQKESIFRSPHDFVLGNPDGDVTVVEYFDYNCGWCKRALKAVTDLTAEDKNVRVVMKEFPIFGEDSEFAAKAALASIKQNKYWQFHTALMSTERVTKQNTLEIAKSVGIDVAALEQEMKEPVYQQVIDDNARVAQSLGMQGTPGFIIDSKVNYGYLPADGLRQILADVRQKGCEVC
ncbi:MAG: DsbA family protein [Alphaproteobacteria bacterium]|nr:DsbA family protein [Alphaproteobacteria bacterium]